MRADLINHILLGFFIATVFQFAGIWVVLIALFTGILKELSDKYIKKTYFDWKDLICTGTGGFIAWWIMLIYN